MTKLKLTVFSIFIAAACSACSGVAVVAHPAPPRSGATLVQVQGAVDGYGEWVVTSRYGRVWRPLAVASNWRPYTCGSWTWVNDAWVWRSDFGWGNVAFNYGAWHQHDVYGWVWRPSTRRAQRRGVWTASAPRRYDRHTTRVARRHRSRPAPSRVAHSRPAAKKVRARTHSKPAPKKVRARTVRRSKAKVKTQVKSKRARKASKRGRRAD